LLSKHDRRDEGKEAESDVELWRHGMLTNQRQTRARAQWNPENQQ
jgi:hypothetical protein